MDLFQILDNDNFEYAAKSDGDESVIVLFFGYAPILNYPKHCGETDSYYFASDKSYLKTAKLKEKLRLSGFEVLECKNLDYKKYAVQAGFLTMGKNTLCYHKKFGSRFVMEYFKVKGKYDRINDSLKILNCANCNLCVKSCPSDALSGGFDITKCLRAKMNRIGIDDDADSLKMGKKILGCDICQKVCPHNFFVKETFYTKKQEELFDLENLFNACLKGKKAMLPYAEEIGFNIARPRRFLSMCINAMGNSENVNYIKLLNNPNIPNELDKDRKRAIDKLIRTYDR